MSDDTSAVTLRPMTVGEFDSWVPGAIENYAADHARMGSRPIEDALASARTEFAQLLPDGVATAHHLLRVAEADGVSVGLLWLFVPEPVGDAPVNAFVYDVEVDAEHRGRGFGRAVMLCAEDLAREHGAQSIRLHVFGYNTVARRLYESLGYETTNVNMAKPLTS